jgi:hypothetical protein
MDILFIKLFLYQYVSIYIYTNTPIFHKIHKKLNTFLFSLRIKTNQNQNESIYTITLFPRMCRIYV